MRTNQQGVTLLELILVLALMSFATMLSFYERQADLEQSRARQVGGLLYQFNNAIRAAMAQGLITGTTTKIGADWLRSVSCGGEQPIGKEFLPCEFPSATVVAPITFGRLTLSTNIVVTGTAPDRKYKSTTTTTPFTLFGRAGSPEVRADLAGVSTLAAAAAMASGFGVNSGGLSPYTATTDASYKSDPKTGVISIISSNSANNDVWLRTDGGNKMHATLGFDGADPVDRQINGASSIQNFAGQVLHIGSGSALSPVTGAGVVIDSSSEVLGDFRIRSGLVVDNSAAVTGNITATGNIGANGAVSAQVFYDSNNSAYYLDPNNTSNVNSINAGGSIAAGGNISAGGSMTAPIFYDANNTAYFLDPTSTSTINALSAKGSIVADGNVTAQGALFGQILYDTNNTGYYVDPHATSNVNAVNAANLTSNGRMRAQEYLELGAVATIGTGCAPNGLLGRTPTGKAISCDSGVWSSLGGLQGPYPVSGTYLGSWALCTLNYTSGNVKQLTYDGTQWVWHGSGTQIIYCYK